MKMADMMIVYKSKYGATRTYASMLSELLSCDAVEAGSCSLAAAEQCSCIIFAGGIYAGGVSVMPFLRKWYPSLKNKKLALLCVGASPLEEKALRELKDHNLKGELKNVPLFYARGAWDESIMSLPDRTMCKILQKVIAGRDPASCDPWMRELLSASGQKCDWTDSSYLTPLLEYIGS